KRLKLDFINNTTENGCPAENPAIMLENLRAIKAKHAALCCQVKEITATQKESIDCIRNSLSSVMKLMQHFQQTTDVEVPTPTYIFFTTLIVSLNNVRQYNYFLLCLKNGLASFTYSGTLTFT
uniref:Protein FAM33A n=1 Tax=Anabas testudineus TaxID=64144 RepID=A0A3Q1IRN2_ANATE